MGESRGQPKFGRVTLEIEDEPNVTARPPPPSSAIPAQSSPGSSKSFGQVDDFDLGDEAHAEEHPPPPSTSRVFGTERNTRATLKNMTLDDESTRVVTGDALSALTRPPPPLSAEPSNTPENDANTRAWDVDALLLEEKAAVTAPPPSLSKEQPAPSGSGVATRGARVAAMRELYAKGDADGALALAATLGDSLAPQNGSDHPDASIVVEFGEQSIDLSDPFGGLIPIDDELAAALTAPPPRPAPSAAPGVAPASIAPAHVAPQLSLTERHSIPKMLKKMSEVSTLKIDHRAGFLLAHVDGMHTLEEILDICAMPPAEALELIANLKRMGVIEFE